MTLRGGDCLERGMRKLSKIMVMVYISTIFGLHSENAFVKIKWQIYPKDLYISLSINCISKEQSINQHLTLVNYTQDKKFKGQFIEDCNLF